MPVLLLSAHFFVCLASPASMCFGRAGACCTCTAPNTLGVGMGRRSVKSRWTNRGCLWLHLYQVGGITEFLWVWCELPVGLPHFPACEGCAGMRGTANVVMLVSKNKVPKEGVEIHLFEVCVPYLQLFSWRLYKSNVLLLAVTSTLVLWRRWTLPFTPLLVGLSDERAVHLWLQLCKALGQSRGERHEHMGTRNIYVFAASCLLLGSEPWEAAFESCFSVEDGAGGWSHEGLRAICWVGLICFARDGLVLVMQII